MYLSIYLFICLSIYIHIYLSIYLSISVAILAQACCNTYSSLPLLMIDALLEEIASVKTFFNGRDYEEVSLMRLSCNFAASLVQQINSCLTISMSDASTVIRALQDSPLGDSNLKQIIAAVDSKVQSSTASRLAVACPKDQVLLEWWNYCTQEDWDFFKSKQGFHAKMTKLVDRGQLVGCLYPDEQSLKWMLAMLLLTH